MDFKLNEDQLAFADSAKALFADFCAPEQQVAYEAGEAGYMQALWQQCMDNGLSAIVLNEAAGGLEQGMTELMAVVIEQGRALAQVPLWQGQLALQAAAAFGAQADLGAEAIIALALQAGVRGSEAAGGLVLSGNIGGVAFADSASHALLAADVAGQTRLALVDLAAAGITRTAGRNHAQTGVAEIALANVQVPANAVLGAGAAAWLEPRVIACLAAQQLGVSAEHLKQTVAYVSERKQFERPIGTFQLVQGKMADCQIAVEALRSALYQLAYRLDANLPSTPQAYATRVLACEAGHLVGHAAQHVHGGIGVDITYPVHRFGCWSRQLNIAHGGIEQNLAALGRWIAGNDKLGWKYDAAEMTQGAAA
ncbi:MAG: acyl-CoA dehydrogenase family protein [Brachymonas sp.]